MKRSLANHDGKVRELLTLASEGVRSALRWLLLSILFRLSEKWCLDGLEIVDVAGANGQVKENLKSALALISRVDPRRYRRLKRDLRRIVLLKGGPPQYASEVHACVLPSKYVREGAPSAVATTMVHEATHARLWLAGIGYGLRIRSRVEVACVRQQLAFANLLGDDHIIAHLNHRLKDLRSQNK